MASRARPALVLGLALLGFLAVVAARSQPADPDARLPRRFRLVGLIHREQRQAVDLRRETDRLRERLTAIRRDAATRHTGTADAERRLGDVEEVNGLVAVAGAGVKVTLDDSKLTDSPTGNLNDLVIHSQDVQAVVNGLWRSGADAIAVNGQRLVATSAVLCVGNTLLLNGTVHSPPYVVNAVGARQDQFEADELVRRLHDDADAFGLRFSVSKESDLRLPAYAGAATPRYAVPVAG
ncbi:MAG: hypothetical protein JWP02_1705 [Acidimicrobiales bacterium]|nr:hypothetical protein [Acidimicrobiales bacterium]